MTRQILQGIFQGKKFFLILIICFLMITPLFVVNAVSIPFGGMVTVMYPCNNGMLLYVYQPLQGIINLFWTYGLLPYLMYTPPHPGQNMIGMRGPVTVPCVLGIYTIGAGFPILYHGESN